MLNIEKIKGGIRPHLFDRNIAFHKIALSFLNGEILDVGCGEGVFLDQAQKLNKSAIGLDHNLHSLGVCEKKGMRIKHGSGLDIPFENESFDSVHCSHVIEHFEPENAYKLLSEIKRVCKINGFVVIQAPLMHNTFYDDDFTHIKPYPPKVILHYLVDSKINRNSTLKKIGGFELVTLKYRYKQLGPSDELSNWIFLYPIFFIVLEYIVSKKTVI